MTIGMRVTHKEKSIDDLPVTVTAKLFIFEDDTKKKEVRSATHKSKLKSLAFKGGYDEVEYYRDGKTIQPDIFLGNPRTREGLFYDAFKTENDPKEKMLLRGKYISTVTLTLEDSTVLTFDDFRFYVRLTRDPSETDPWEKKQ